MIFLQLSSMIEAFLHLLQSVNVLNDFRGDCTLLLLSSPGLCHRHIRRLESNSKAPRSTRTVYITKNEKLPAVHSSSLSTRVFVFVRQLGISMKQATSNAIVDTPNMLYHQDTSAH